MHTEGTFSQEKIYPLAVPIGRGSLYSIKGFAQTIIIASALLVIYYGSQKRYNTFFKSAIIALGSSFVLFCVLSCLLFRVKRESDLQEEREEEEKRAYEEQRRENVAQIAEKLEIETTLEEAKSASLKGLNEEEERHREVLKEAQRYNKNKEES